MFYDILSSLALQIYAKVKLRPNRLFYSTCGPLNDVTNHKRKFSTKKVLSPRKQKNGINYNYCKIFIKKIFRFYALHRFLDIVFDGTDLIIILSFMKDKKENIAASHCLLHITDTCGIKSCVVDFVEKSWILISHVCIIFTL